MMGATQMGGRSVDRESGRTKTSTDLRQEEASG
jgi:hypothetical protein